MLCSLQSKPDKRTWKLQERRSKSVTTFVLHNYKKAKKTIRIQPENAESPYISLGSLTLPSVLKGTVARQQKKSFQNSQSILKNYCQQHAKFSVIM